MKQSDRNFAPENDNEDLYEFEKLTAKSYTCRPRRMLPAIPSSRKASLSEAA